ncbi:MAG: 1,4-alpha-glucan branching enzyme [Solirubrobacteraceae bacterium]|jgi:1,4-alpha-glucan branching enzyme|nr:1,4-alpha-glucan branching enzyme [Solirubrobacteraceae bacterium]
MSLSGPDRPGKLAIVLHTHMPYVEGGGQWPPAGNSPDWSNREGFGTWPFGEEWLWEAIATCYLPLLDRVLGRVPLTLSLTPVLADQLEQPEAIERCLSFLEGIRPETHRRDAAELRTAGQPELATEIERAAADYAWAATRLRDLGSGGLLTGLSAHASWTSAATHAVLPLLATDAGLEAQIATGIAAHRRRAGSWAGGFWLPECAHAPWLDAPLEAAGVSATCVELTRVFGLGDARHLRPLSTEDGPVLWPIDRAVMGLVWSQDGYPSRGSYRDYHGHTTFRLHAWSNDGTPYEPVAARAQAEADAADFVARVLARVTAGGVCVCALDTELLGHWWYEGVDWLAAVIDESARQGLELVTLDAALDGAEPVPAPVALPITSWGEGGDLRTWSAPRVSELAFAARCAELRLAAADRPVAPRAARELLALQSSDWAFLAYRGTAGEYPRERFLAHLSAFGPALEGELEPELRGLAPDLVLGAWS